MVVNDFRFLSLLRLIQEHVPVQVKDIEPTERLDAQESIYDTRSPNELDSLPQVP
jgi:hypothetical protein